jgi:thiamine-phosphate pyrophosphorylase
VKSPVLNRPKPLVYLITDRHSLDPGGRSANEALIDLIRHAVAAGVDLVQIRERDLSARDMFLLAENAAVCARGSGTAILINDRADIAAACGIGVHLTTHSMKADVIRRAFGDDMLIGASTHSLDEVAEAEAGGADFVVFGPVFETESKKQYGPPVGLNALRDASAHSKIPVLALGGITGSNFRQALDAGAAGVAGISLFAQSQDLANLIHTIKNL